MACSDPTVTTSVPFDASRQRRVFVKPPGTGARAMPPHAIRAEGVGPYKLGSPLQAILRLLPRGPRVSLMEIDGVVAYSLVRAEADALVIGAASRNVSFVSVVEKEIARTETGGVGVGATRAELDAALGNEVSKSSRVLDPRVAVYENLPNARFVVSNNRVAAIMIGLQDKVERPPGRSRTLVVEPELEPNVDQPSEVAPAPTVAARRCLLDELKSAQARIIAAARLPKRPPPRVAYGCFGGDALAIVAGNDRVVVLVGEPGNLRRVAAQSVPKLTFAGPIDVDGDGRDEIAIVSRNYSPALRAVLVEVFRFEAGKYQRVASREVYGVTAAAAAWAGAQLDEIDLLIELRVHARTLRVGGLYVQRAGSKISNVVPLVSHKIRLRRRGSAEKSDAGRDAGPDPRSRRSHRDAGVAKRGAKR